jgi:hypothetical protein
LAALPEGYPLGLAALTPEQVKQIRQVYFDAVEQYITRQERSILVDVDPLNICESPLIWRIFPNAKFVLVLRHPYDVCLSCFMQPMTFSTTIGDFFTLDGAATLYAKWMELWRRSVELLPLDCHVIKYENLVSDFEAETRRLLDFVGVEWDDAVLDHAGRAKSSGKIDTPSYHQVVQPIYEHAKYRWQRYRPQIEPIAHTLRPFVEYFGYDDQDTTEV